ncbi:MAG: PARP-type zinc finger-containing protein [Promethearchaeota archaeon]|jgi:hypothetical protein
MSYKIEYAKSSRATCKVCGEKIEKRDIRIGVPSYFQQYLSYKWQHAKCTIFGGQVPKPVDMDGFDEIEENDKQTLDQNVQTVDAESIAPTKLTDIITPDKVIPRIDGTVTRIGTIQDNTESGGSVFSSIMISDGDSTMSVMGFGSRPARDLVNLDLKGVYRFYGLRTTLSSQGNIILKHEGATKFDLVIPGEKKKIITDDDWGDFKDLRLTISNRKANCSICEESILGHSFRLTTKGEREVQGRMWVVDRHQHLNCAEVEPQYLVDIWNHLVDKKIFTVWRFKPEKIEQAYLDYLDTIKKKDKKIAKELQPLPNLDN